MNADINPHKPEIILVDDHADGVACDGGHPALGHPKTWYSLEKQDFVECGYCDRLFVKDRAIGQFENQS